MADDEEIDDGDLEEEELEPDEELDDDDLEEDGDLVLVEDLDDELEVVEVVDDDEVTETPKVAAAEDDENEDDDDDVLDPDDVEADLDSILKERLVVAEDEDEEEEEEVADPEDRSDGRVRPRAPGEFVCQSCFLVKHPSQLADAKRQLCADCV